MKKREFTKVAHNAWILGILALLLLLGGCSGGTKSESDIMADIKAQDNYFSKYELKIDDYSITKRQTNQDSKTDYVWVQVDASNDDFTYYGEYVLTYVMYNDGWMLEDYEREDWQYVGSHPESVQQSDAEQLLASQGYDKWYFVKRQEEENCVTYNYFANKTDYYLTESYNVTIDFQFSPGSLWSDYSIDQYNYDTYLDTTDVIGEWVYQDNERDFYINIVKVSRDNEAIDIEYNLKNAGLNTIWYDRTATFVSNGVVTKKLRESSALSHMVYRIEGISDSDYECSVGIYTGNTGELTGNGEGYGVYVSGYWLTKK